MIAHLNTWSVIALALVTSIAQGQAVADERTAYARARELFEEATLYYDARDFARARELFTQAHALEAGAPTLRALGSCDLQLEHFALAVAEFEAALADARPEKQLTPSERLEVEQALTVAQRYVGVLRVDVQPPDAQLVLDGQAASGTRFVLDVGGHTVSAHLDELRKTTVSVTISARAEQHISLVLPAISVAAQPQVFMAKAAPMAALAAADVRPLSPTAVSNVLQTWWFWAAAGAVVVAGATVTAVAISHSAAATGTGTNVLKGP